MSFVNTQPVALTAAVGTLQGRISVVQGGAVTAVDADVVTPRIDRDRALLEYFDQGMQAHVAVAKDVHTRLAEPFADMLAAWEAAIRNGGKILFFGNGGSASDAQHLATELTVRFHADRAAIAAIALTTDTSTLTAAANDMGFEMIFARQIEAIGRPGDLALGISTSGMSPNVLRALTTARERGLRTAALTGGTGGRIASLADHCLVVPSTDTARIQEMHITLGQLLCGALEQRLGLV
jgi:D-sedoheptulose 7-phosphate isomerase